MLFHDASLLFVRFKLIGVGKPVGYSFSAGRWPAFWASASVHVFTVFSFAVPVRAGFVVDAGVGVDRDHAADICRRSLLLAAELEVMAVLEEPELFGAAKVFFLDLVFDLVALVSV
jgi:hypothetical protein